MIVSVKQYDIPKSPEQCRQRLREEFLKHNDIKDIRIVDMLVIKVSLYHVILYDCSTTYHKILFLFNSGPNGVKRNSKHLETKGTYNGLL